MAARRLAEGRARGGAGPVRRRPRLLAPLPAAPGRRRVLRRAHDRAPRARRRIPGDKETIFHAHQKVAHRAHPDVEIEGGNHNADGAGSRPAARWHPIEVLHFSFRSVAPARAQGRDGGWLRNPTTYEPTAQLLLDEALPRGASSRLRGHAVDDEALARGLADGTLAIDTRLRDALRTLRDDGRRASSCPATRRSSVPAPDAARTRSTPPRRPARRDRRRRARRAARATRSRRGSRALERGPLAVGS